MPDVQMRGVTWFGLLPLAVLAASACSTPPGGGSGSAAAAGAVPSGNCAAVEVLSARGTGEPQSGSIIMGGVPREVARRTGGGVYQVRYPASVDYLNGPNQGASDALAHLQSQAAACPRQKFVLTGYSEGAMVMTTLMNRIPAEIAPRVAAAVLYGNPYYKSDSPSAAGSAKGRANGLVPVLGIPAGFASRTRDYCNEGDPVCGGGANVAAHLTYSEYDAEAVAFAVSKVQATPTPAGAAPATTVRSAAEGGGGETKVAAVVATPRYTG